MVLFAFLALSALFLLQPLECWSSSDTAAAAASTVELTQGHMMEPKERLMKTRLEEELALHSERLDRLETLVAQQAQTIASQGRQLREQAGEATRLESLVRSQNARMTYQAHQLCEQAGETTRLESLVRSQNARITYQARLLRSRAETASGLQTLVGQQAESVSRLESQLRSQDAHMSYQGGLLRVQAELLRGQQHSLGQLRAAVTRLQGHAVAVTRLQGHAVAVTRLQGHAVAATNDTGRHTTTAGGQGIGHVSSQAHARTARADDFGVLEAVVSQVGQQVTELEADLQAFRTQTTSDLQTVRDSNSQQDQQIQDARTSTFVHWGSSQCSNSSRLVYSGVVGGSHFSVAGAATNYLCLTLGPVFSDAVPSAHARALLYGAEYESYDSHQEKDAVCAVCRASHSTTIMIPGTNACATGWQQQYGGYLMAGYEGHAAGSEFICVDSAMESRMSSSSDRNGKLLYYTATRCGSLPCDPYVNDQIVTCVVCSQ